MKTRFLTAFRLAVVTASVLSTLASAQSHLDISLEGPWILYTDTTLAQWPLLVVIAPGDVQDENKPNYFHTITVSAGDGYPVGDAHVYCLTFDGKCGKKLGSSMDPDHYPTTVAPLPVKAGANWDWSHKYTSGAIAFILPMPTSYSVVGGWYMKFAKTFDNTGANYKYYNNLPEYATGVQLHYDNGPGGFALKHCDPITGVPIDLSKDCTDADGTYLSNIGTLTIAMKAKDDPNACDPHVRHAYPRMIALLDDKNSDVAVIDLAKGSDKNNNNAPIWDKDQDTWRCLDHDEQGGGTQTHGVAANKHEYGAMPKADASWVSQLDALLKFIDEHRELDASLLLPQIKEASDKLDRSFPRFSQTILLQTLVRQSKSILETLLSDKVKHANPQEGTKSAYTTLNGLETRFLTNGPPTKSGNDCKAPMMLVQ